MDTEKCKVLATVLQEGNLSKAAEKLGYTVSGVSRSLSSLEEECGLKLLFRDRYGVKLTKDGEELYPIIKEFLNINDRYENKISNIRGMECGHISVGVAYISYFRNIAKVAHSFQKQHPGVVINIIQGTSSELKQELQMHNLDIIIASKRDGDFIFDGLSKAPMCALVNPEHECAKYGQYPLKRFETDTMIMPFSGSETDCSITLAEHGINPNIVHRTTDIYAAYSMVEAGIGVTFLNSLEPECWQGNVKSVHVVPECSIDIGMMYFENMLSESAKSFLLLLKGEQTLDGQ